VNLRHAAITLLVTVVTANVATWFVPTAPAPTLLALAVGVATGLALSRYLILPAVERAAGA
jgi:tetrahydromethanopterin S-methyltransferase subunit D